MKNKNAPKKAKEMMLDGEFSSADYRGMKIEIESKLEQLVRDEVQLKSGTENLNSKVDECLDFLLNLDKHYAACNTEVKQRIIGSIFTEKLIFEKNTYRTPKLNLAFSLICNNNKDLKSIKKGKKLNFSTSSLGVDFTDKISNQLLKDIETLSSLKRYISSH